MVQVVLKSGQCHEVGKKLKYMIAMSSSRSDVVTQSVCSSVRPSVRPLVMKEFFFSYKVVSRKSNGCFNEVSSCFMQVSWIGSFKCV